MFNTLAIADLLNNLPKNFSNCSIVKLPATLTTSMLIISLRLANCSAYLASKFYAIHFDNFRLITKLELYETGSGRNIFLSKNNNSSFKNVDLQLTLNPEIHYIKILFANMKIDSVKK